MNRTELDTILVEVGAGLPGKGFIVRENDTSPVLRIDFEAITRKGEDARSLDDDTKVDAMTEVKNRCLAGGLRKDQVRLLLSTRVRTEDKFYKEGAAKPWPRIVVNLTGPAFYHQQENQAAASAINDRVDQLEKEVKDNFTTLFAHLGIVVQEPVEPETEVEGDDPEVVDYDLVEEITDDEETPAPQEDNDEAVA